MGTKYEKGGDGEWLIGRPTGPLTMCSNWEGWGEYATNNTRRDKIEPAPDLPPAVFYLTYPASYIVPFHYPNPVSGRAFLPGMGEAGAYHRPPRIPDSKQRSKSVEP